MLRVNGALDYGGYPFLQSENWVQLMQKVYKKSTSGSVNSGGKITSEYFLYLFLLAQYIGFISCFIKKIAINLAGEFKICPSIQVSLGRLGNHNIENIINQDIVMKYWSTGKDAIEVCCDCEYRMVCSDCRVNTVNNEFRNKPANCSYDPYKGVSLSMLLFILMSMGCSPLLNYSTSYSNNGYYAALVNEDKKFIKLMSADYELLDPESLDYNALPIGVVA